MKYNSHDVIIVGAGPIGSYTAYLLAKKGLNVGLFEKNPLIGKDVNCTGIVSAECLDRFTLWDHSVLKPVTAIKAVSPSGICLKYHSKSPFAYIINRSVFDFNVNRKAVSEGAITYLCAHVRDISITEDKFQIRVKSRGSETRFTSKIGVIATGFEFNSLLDKNNCPKDYLYGIQINAIMNDIEGIEVYFGKDIAPSSFAWVVPVNGNSVKVGLITKKKPAEYLKRFIETPVIKQRINTYENTVKCSPIPFDSIPRSYAERLIIVGEAAGQVKTTTGGGIYFGLLCAEAAAKTIIKAFDRGDFSERLLQEYEKEWRGIIEPELKSGKLLRNIFSKLSDYQIDFIIDFARRDGIIPIIKESDFDWHKDLIAYLFRKLFTKKIFHIQK